MSIITTIDLETTTIESMGRTANPLDPRNKVIAAQYKVYGEDAEVLYNKKGIDLEKYIQIICQPDVVLVGHNLKFDLLYLWPYEPFRVWLKEEGKVWDTLLVEYMLSGQLDVLPSLDKLSAKYGGTIKDDRIKEMWKAGYSTEDIPEEMLIEYARYDVINTEIIFTKQYAQAKEKGLIPLIKSECTALLATTEMEYNGMQLDNDTREDIANKLVKKREELDKEIEATILKEYPELNHKVEGCLFNLNSAKQQAAYIFGGSVVYRVHEHMTDEEGNVLVYGPKAKKAGEPRVKVVEKEVNFRSQWKAQEEWKSEKTGAVGVGDTVLSFLSKCRKEKLASFCQLLLEKRKTDKLINAYIEGYDKCIYPDNRLHPQYNHAVTVTGRLSCRAPNLQQLPRSVE